jgi:hypothetical protein
LAADLEDVDKGRMEWFIGLGAADDGSDGCNVDSTAHEAAI